MAAAAVGGGIGDADALNAAGIISGHLLLLDGHGHLGHTVMLTQTGGAGAHQPVELRLGIAHALGPLDGGGGIAPLQQRAVAVLGLDGTALVQLHGSGDGAGNGDGIQAVLVAPVVGFVDGGQVGIGHVCTVGPQGLVFGTADDLVAHLDHTAAGNGAAVAGTGLDQELLSQSLTGDILGLVVVAFLPVLGGQGTDAVDDVDQRSRAQSPQTAAGQTVLADVDHDLLVGGLQILDGSQRLVGILPGGGDDDALELLGAHDGTDTGAAGGAVLVVHDGGEQHLLLTGDADGQNGGSLAVLFLQLLVQLLGEQAQIFPGIQKLDLVVDNVDVGPLGSLALDDQGIPAGVLELGTPDAAGVGAGDHAGQGGLGDDHVTAGGGGTGTGQGAGDVDQLVVRTQGVGSGAALVVDDLGAEAAAADELLSQFHIELFDLDLTGGQIDAGEFFVVCVCHNDNLQKECIFSCHDGFLIAWILLLYLK